MKRSLALAFDQTLELYRGVPEFSDEVDGIDEGRRALVRFARKLNTADRDSWKSLITAVLAFGVTEEELQHVIAASPSTIYRWLNEGVAPREGTRRLMKAALLDLLNEKISEQSGGDHSAKDDEAQRDRRQLELA